MSLYAAKLKGSAKKITKKADLEPVAPPEPVVDKKQAAKLARQEKALKPKLLWKLKSWN